VRAWAKESGRYPLPLPPRLPNTIFEDYEGQESA
jgi:hypothetical protein